MRVCICVCANVRIHAKNDCTHMVSARECDHPYTLALLRVYTHTPLTYTLAAVNPYALAP